MATNTELAIFCSNDAYTLYICGRREILESNNSDLLENKEALEFMRQNGPDTLINCVSLNIKEYNHHRFASL
jgi:hypothetical protein